MIVVSNWIFARHARGSVYKLSGFNSRSGWCVRSGSGLDGFGMCTASTACASENFEFDETKIKP